MSSKMRLLCGGAQLEFKDKAPNWIRLQNEEEWEAAGSLSDITMFLHFSVGLLLFTASPKTFLFSLSQMF